MNLLQLSGLVSGMPLPRGQGHCSENKRAACQQAAPLSQQQQPPGTGFKLKDLQASIDVVAGTPEFFLGAVGTAGSTG